MSNRKQNKDFVALEYAQNHGIKIDWNASPTYAPARPGTHVFNNLDVALIQKYIDWTPFFMTWELAGKYPHILTDAVVGTEATNLYNDAQAMLQKIVNEQWLTARAVVGLLPAYSTGDDIVVASNNEKITLHHLRQQTRKADGQSYNCLADFIKPKNRDNEDFTDTIGAFAVTAGIGIEAHLERFRAEQDDYSVYLAASPCRPPCRSHS